MPRYLCDYCDAYLTHDSVLGRHQHARGGKHVLCFQNYYAQFFPQFVAEQQALQAQQAMAYQFPPSFPPQPQFPIPGHMPLPPPPPLAPSAPSAPILPPQ